MFITVEFTIDTTVRNKWLLTKNNNIIEFQYLEIINDKMYIYGSEVISSEDFYELPIKSSNLNIYKTSKCKKPLTY